MIDLQSEALVPLRDVPDLLPSRQGRKLHVSTAYRWAQRGVGGRRLETVQIGGQTYTSREALDRFAIQPEVTGSGRPTSSQRQRLHEQEQAEHEADSLGLG